MGRLIRLHGGVYETFLCHLNHSGLSDLIDVIRVPSPEAAALVGQVGQGGLHRTPHFVFIDGNHGQEAVSRDIEAWWGTGTEWIAGHDYDRKGVSSAVNERFGQEVEIRRGTCWITRRKR
jgi:hypothetical protein